MKKIIMLALSCVSIAAYAGGNGQGQNQGGGLHGRRDR